VKIGESSTFSVTVVAQDLTSKLVIQPISPKITVSYNLSFGYQSALSIYPLSDGSVPTTTIYIKYTPTTETVDSLDINFTSIDAITELLEIDGGGKYPYIDTDPIDSLYFGNIAVGVESSTEAIILTGEFLGENVIITSNSLQITLSLTGLVFSYSITMDTINGELLGDPGSTVYLKCVPDVMGPDGTSLSFVSDGLTSFDYTIMWVGV
jgi:hypothetical protein